MFLTYLLGTSYANPVLLYLLCNSTYANPIVLRYFLLLLLYLNYCFTYSTLLSTLRQLVVYLC